MKILFFIAVLGYGRGGHIHSLNHISRELGKIHQIKIITIGSGFSSIIEENPFFYKHIKLNRFNLHDLLLRTRLSIKNIGPDIIHFFDSASYNLLRLQINSKRNKVVVTKCGGPNIIWPFVNNLILFSQENYDWYTKIRKFKSANIYLIPNRVKRLDINESFKPIEKIPDFFYLLRICRIGPTHKKSIEDSITLVKYLIGKGHSNVKLYIIGYIEDNNIYNEFTKSICGMENSIFFVTSSHITKDASKMLYLADAVIGTGRGFMESASLSIPLLTINAESNFPVLIDQNNFFDAFKTNFSNRNIFSSYDSEVNLKNIERMISDKQFYNTLSLFSKNIFHKYFNIIEVSTAYTNVYKNAISGKNRYIAESLIILKEFYHFIVSSYTFDRIRINK